MKDAPFCSILGTNLSTVQTFNGQDLSLQVIRDKLLESQFCLYLYILIYVLVFTFWHVIEGVFCEKPFELLASVILTLIVLLYCVLEFCINGHNDAGQKYELKLVSLSY